MDSKCSSLLFDEIQDTLFGYSCAALIINVIEGNFKMSLFQNLSLYYQKAVRVFVCQERGCLHVMLKPCLIILTDVSSR